MFVDKVKLSYSASKIYYCPTKDMFLFSRAFLLSFSLKLLYQWGKRYGYSNSTKRWKTDYPTKEPVRNPQQSNEQANPMGQLEKKSVSGSYRIDSRQRSALLRRHALHQKYDKAVALYAETDMPLKTIAMECHVSAEDSAVTCRRYWRELVLHRHRIPLEGEIPMPSRSCVRGKPNVMSQCQI